MRFIETISASMVSIEAMNPKPIIQFMMLIGFSSSFTFNGFDTTHPISDVRMYASVSIAIDMSVVILCCL